MIEVSASDLVPSGRSWRGDRRTRKKLWLVMVIGDRPAPLPHQHRWHGPLGPLWHRSGPQETVQNFS